MTADRYFWATWLFLGLALLVRLLISSQFLLTPDETNYWQWSRYLDIGYHDHPPMIAWTIWLATSLFGQTEFAVRLPTIIGISIASGYLCLLTGRFFSWHCALYVALLSQVTLLLNGSALIATPDGLLLPCWAAACYHAARAMQRNTMNQWLLTGIWFGLGLLSKYTMLLFLPSLFFAMLADSHSRRLLAGYKPWLGLAAGFIVFTPVIIWNAQHDWTTFRHVLFQGGANESTLFTLRYIYDFLGSQAALLSPLVFLLLIACWCRGGFSKKVKNHETTSRISFLIFMSLTSFLVFFLLAFHVRIYGNWPAPAYLTGLILVAALCSPGRVSPGVDKNRLWQFSLGLSALTTILLLAQLVYPVLPVKVDLDRIARETTGWKTLAQKVDTVYEQMENTQKTFIFGLRYQLASELAFYMQGQPRTVSINRWSRPNVYDFWFDDSMVKGMDGVGVFEHRDVITLLPQVFERVGSVEEIALSRPSLWFGEELVQTLYLARCYGFKGGLRWQPRDTGDIRAAVE